MTALCWHWHHWLALVVAFVFGGLLGMVVMALAAAAKDPEAPP